MGALAQDLRYGLRMLAKSPAFTIIAVITLAIGIGANTAIFSVARGIWLNPLPFTDSSRIVFLAEQGLDSGYWALPAGTFSRWKTRVRSFSGIAAYAEEAGAMSADGNAARVTVGRVSPQFFATLGAHPALGRLWTGEEKHQGTVIISYSLWKNRFGGDAGILGRHVRLNAEPVTIIGVMGKTFNFPAGDDLWTRFAFTPNDWSDTKAHRVRVIARLQPGSSIAKAEAEMQQISAALATEDPGDYRDRHAVVLPATEYINGNLTPVFTRTLLGAVALVLIIACVNVSGLQLARASARRREFAVREALGAGRWRLARQLLVESMSLAFAGAAAGIVLAVWMLHIIVSTLPADIARQIAGWNNIRIDPHTLLYTAATAVFAGMLAGIAPALRGSHVRATDAMKGEAASEGSSAQRLRAVLVGGEVALALALVVATALIVKGFGNIMGKVQRFAPQQLLTAQVDLSTPAYTAAAKRAAFFNDALARVGAMPGMSDAFLFTSAPFSNNGVDWESFHVSGMPIVAHAPRAIVQIVSPGFFEHMPVPLLSGRNFTAGDAPTTLPVAIISSKLASRYWPRESPLNRSVEIQADGKRTTLTVVGVAADVQYDWTDDAPEPVIYRPFAQAPPQQAYVAVRSSYISGAATDMRVAIAAIDRDVPVDISSLGTLVWYALSGVAEVGGMMGAFGIIALILACAGVYGMVAYSVSRRTREIAIRMAVGARHSNVLLLILRGGMAPVAVGIVAGTCVALVLGRVVADFFFGVSSTDIQALIAAALAFGLVALVASYIPARRAVRIDPMVALRYE